MRLLPRGAKRRGFTLVEILVSVSVIGVILAITLPAMGRARDRVRVLGCLTNERQITMAMTTFAQGAPRQLYHPDYGEGATDDLSYLYLGGYLGNYDVARCPSTENIIDIRVGRYYDPKTQKFVDGTDYSDLISPASHAHDDAGGHSYELFHIATPGQFPNGLTLDDETDITLSLVGTLFDPTETFICLDNDDDPLNGGINIDGLFGYNNLPDAQTNNHGDRGCNVGFLDGHAEFIPMGNWVRTITKSTHVGAINYARARVLDPGYREGPRTDGVAKGERYYFVN